MKAWMVLLLVGLSAGACTHCYSDPVGHSSHPRAVARFAELHDLRMSPGPVA